MISTPSFRAQSATGHAPSQDLVAVIDIGSNSVRMVVFSGTGRWPLPVFNERTLCGLGRGLSAARRLDSDGVELALFHLRRFAVLGSAMGVAQWEVVATEAVRVASDGREFVARAERILGQPVCVLDGEREAEMAALGVVSGIPGADGFMGDLGGGSLELVALDNGSAGSWASLPLGVLRLISETDGGETAKAEARIDEALAKVPWLGDVEGRCFYPVGGAWRAFATVHMSHTEYPLHVIHEYDLSRRETLELLRLVGKLSPESLGKIPRVPKARLWALPMAAKLMERLLVAARPERVVFSAHGLREGWLYGRLDPDLRTLDPLLAGCAQYGDDHSRFGAPGTKLARWTDSLFPDESPGERRLREAAAYLSDIGWRDHPDYRAEDSFSRVLHLPLAGLSHRERIFLAFAAAARYGGGSSGAELERMRTLIDDSQLASAFRVGRALRFGLTLSGGALALLDDARLALDDQELVLILSNDMRYMMSDVATRRFEALASRFGRTPRISA